MDIFTLYVGNGSLAAVRSGDEAIIVDAHMPAAGDITAAQIEQTLQEYLPRHTLRGLILTSLGGGHASPVGVESILSNFEPKWVMYPKSQSDTDDEPEVAKIIAAHEMRRRNSVLPLQIRPVRLDGCNRRSLEDLGEWFSGELFAPDSKGTDSPHAGDIVLKLTGLDRKGFRYLITGDTDAGSWNRINAAAGPALASDVMAAPRHGSRAGVNAKTLVQVRPHTVLINAGVNNLSGHPDTAAVRTFQRIAEKIYSTNMTPEGTCLFTHRVGEHFETRLVRHAAPAAVGSGE